MAVWFLFLTTITVKRTPKSGVLSSYFVSKIYQCMIAISFWPYHLHSTLTCLCIVFPNNASPQAPRIIDLYSTYCSSHDSAVQIAVQLERDRVYSMWINACNELVYSREQVNAGSQAATHTSDATEPMARPVLKFSSRLITPVQRFQRYHLLIERLIRLSLTEADK